MKQSASVICYRLLLSACEMTYIVSGGALNYTHSLTHSNFQQK